MKHIGFRAPLVQLDSALDYGSSYTGSNPVRGAKSVPSIENGMENN